MNNPVLSGTITNEIQLSGECSEMIKYKAQRDVL